MNSHLYSEDPSRREADEADVPRGLAGGHLNKQQEKLLRLIMTWRGPGLPLPSTIAEEMGFAGESSVRWNLNLLEAAGLIERSFLGSGLPKVPKVTNKGRQLIGVKPIPMFGPVHGGECGTQYDEQLHHIRDLNDLFPLRDDEYFLPVAGDCMDGGDEPIKPGDIVLLRPCSRIYRPANGSVAHVEVGLAARGESEPLLREYWFEAEAGEVTLRCHNPEYAGGTYPDESVDPRGAVVSVIHHVTIGLKARNPLEVAVQLPSGSNSSAKERRQSDDKSKSNKGVKKGSKEEDKNRNGVDQQLGKPNCVKRASRQSTVKAPSTTSSKKI